MTLFSNTEGAPADKEIGTEFFVSQHALQDRRNSYKSETKPQDKSVATTTKSGLGWRKTVKLTDDLDALSPRTV